MFGWFQVEAFKPKGQMMAGEDTMIPGPYDVDPDPPISLPSRLCGCSNFGPCVTHTDAGALQGDLGVYPFQPRPEPAKLHLWYCTGCKRVGYVPVIEGESNALDTMKRMDEKHRAISPDCCERVSPISGLLVDGIVDVLRKGGAIR